LREAEDKHRSIKKELVKKIAGKLGGTLLVSA